MSNSTWTKTIRKEYWRRKTSGRCIVYDCPRKAGATVRCEPCRKKENERKRHKAASIRLRTTATQSTD